MKRLLPLLSTLLVASSVPAFADYIYGQFNGPSPSGAVPFMCDLPPDHNSPPDDYEKHWLTQ